MDDLSYYLALTIWFLFLFLQAVIFCLEFLLFCHFYYLVFDFIESAPRKDEKVASLRVFADDFIDYLMRLVVNHELLEDLRYAATIKNCPFYDFTHVSLLVIYLYSWATAQAATKIRLSNPSIGNMIVIVLTNDTPWPMRCRQKKPLPKRNWFLKIQIDISLQLIGGISGIELIFVGEIAGHEWQPDTHRNWDGVVAVFERIRDLAEDEVSVFFKSAPIKNHNNVYDVFIWY